MQVIDLIFFGSCQPSSLNNIIRIRMTDKVLGIDVHKMINDVTYSCKNFMLPVSFKGEEHTYWFCPFCWDVFKNNRENKPERHVLYYHGGESKVIKDKFLSTD